MPLDARGIRAGGARSGGAVRRGAFPAGGLLACLLAASALASTPPRPRPAPTAARPAPAPRPDSPEGLWAAARQLVAGDSAAARYRQLAERHPRHPLARLALLELADYQYARGEYRAARQLYRRARGPEAARARLGDALCTYALGEPDEARRIALPLLGRRSDPLSWLAALLVAQSWEAEGRVPEALAAYRRLLDLPSGPAEPAALLGAARVAERAGQGEDAARLLQRLRASFPQSPEAAEARSLGGTPAAASKR